jgi:hypothetical protein
MGGLEAVTPDVVGAAVRCLEDALCRVRDACAALDEQARRLKEGAKPGDVAGAVALVTKAALAAQAERGKIEDALREERGADGVDLLAAREEVGRRLDLLVEERRKAGLS